MKNDEPPSAPRRMHWESWRTPRPKQGFIEPFVDEPGEFSSTLQWRAETLFWLLPPLGILFALIERDSEIYAVTAAVFWPVLLVMWIPAAFYLVLRENPEADLWRAAAYLAHAVWPFAFVAFGAGALVIVFPFGWLLGVWASFKARSGPRRPLTRRQRLRLLISGSLGWGFSAAALLTRGGLVFVDLLRRVDTDGFAIMLGAFAVLIGACSAWLAWRLTKESLRTWRMPETPPPAPTAA